MNENKPYEVRVNERGQLDIIDHIEVGKKMRFAYIMI